MEYKFNKRCANSSLEVKIGDHPISLFLQFQYNGSIIQNDIEIERDINYRVQAGWILWRSALGVICDRKISLELKEKIYRTTIKPAMLYGIECWAI